MTLISAGTGYREKWKIHFGFQYHYPFVSIVCNRPCYYIHKEEILRPFKPATCFWSAYTKPVKWAVVCMCVVCICVLCVYRSCLCFYDITIGFWNCFGGLVYIGTVSAIWYILELFRRSGIFWNCFGGLVYFGTVSAVWYILVFILLQI